MALAKIKKQHNSTFIAFNGGGAKVLGERDDIDQLAILAHESGNKNLIDLFEDLPSLDVLKKAKTDGQLQAAPSPLEAAEQDLLREVDENDRAK